MTGFVYQALLDSIFTINSHKIDRELIRPQDELYTAFENLDFIQKEFKHTAPEIWSDLDVSFKPIYITKRKRRAEKVYLVWRERKPHKRNGYA